MKGIDIPINMIITSDILVLHFAFIDSHLCAQWLHHRFGCVVCPSSFSFCFGHVGVAQEAQKAGRARLCRNKEKGVAWHQGEGLSKHQK